MKFENGFFINQNALYLFKKYLINGLYYDSFDMFDKKSITKGFLKYVKSEISIDFAREQIEKYDIFSLYDFVFQSNLEKSKKDLFYEQRNFYLLYLSDIAPAVFLVLLEKTLDSELDDFFQKKEGVGQEKTQMLTKKMELIQMVDELLASDSPTLFQEKIKLKKDKEVRVLKEENVKKDYGCFSYCAALNAFHDYLINQDIKIENGLVVGKSYPSTVNLKKDNVSKIASEIVRSIGNYHCDSQDTLLFITLINLSIDLMSDKLHIINMSWSEELKKSNLFNKCEVTFENVMNVSLYYILSVMLNEMFEDKVYTGFETEELINKLLRNGESVGLKTNNEFDFEIDQIFIATSF